MATATPLSEVATELLNKAKLSSSAQDKLFNLEQIKEVIFHRDQSLFPQFLGDITDFVIDKAVSVKKFLAGFGGETISKFPLHTAAIMQMFDFLIRDESDSVVRAVVTELTRHYGRIAMHIVGLDTRSSQSFFAKNDKKQSPKSLWELLKGMEAVAIEVLSSGRTAALRAQCIRLLLSVLLFSLPLDLFSQESAQKRARLEGVAGRTQSSFNVASISLHHAFLRKDQIEEQAKSLLIKLSIWATRGGPQGAQFTDEQMGELAVVLSSIAADRPREARSVLPAVTFLVSSLAGREGAKALVLPGALRATFLELAESLCDRSGATGNEEERKLKEAVDHVNATAVSAAGAGAALLGNLLKMDEEFSSEEDEPIPMSASTGDAAVPTDDIDDDDNDQRIKNRAIAAINSMSSAPGSLEESSKQGEAAAAAAEGQSAEARNSRDTVLAEDAPSFPLPSSTSPLWGVVARGQRGELSFKPSDSLPQQNPDVFFSSSFLHLHNMLTVGAEASRKMPEKGQAVFVNMAIRLILALSLGDVGGVSMTAVPQHCVRTKSVSIFQNIRVTESDMLCDPPVPLQVSLPSVLVFVLGFCIKRIEDSTAQQGLSARAIAAAEVAVVQFRINLLTGIAHEIFNRSLGTLATPGFDDDSVELSGALSVLNSNGDSNMDTEESNPPAEDVIMSTNGEVPERITDLRLYEDFCLATFSRLFQRNQHRQKGAVEFLFNLPVIPDAILHVLKMLMYSGTSPDAAAEKAAIRKKRRRGSDAGFQEPDLGTRMASMELLSQVCLIEPVDDSNHTTNIAMSQLLWAATSSDFKTRTSAINIVVSELVSNGMYLNDIVTLFALQSALIISGSETVTQRCTSLHDFRKSADTEIAGLNELGSSEKCVSVNIEDASLQFDGGSFFYGSFQTSMDALVALEDNASVASGGGDAKTVDGYDAIMRRHLHLLIQLCLCNPDTLESLFNLYGASAAVLEQNPSAYRHEMACRIIKSEFCNILASLASSFPAEKVIGPAIRADPLARKLVILTLETVFLSSTNPASPAMVAAVRHYVNYQALYWKLIKDSASESETTENEPDVMQKLASTELLVPVMSGLTASEVVDQIPFIIVLCLRYNGYSEHAEEAAEDEDSSEARMTALFHAFSGIVRPRPPPLSKAGLLVALHRLSAEDKVLTDKEIQDAIGLCINKIKPQWDLDIKGSVVTEAALKLLTDDSAPLPFQIMRTLLLACRTMPEVMRFMLSEAIPRLARRKSWVTAPRVWDGVLHAMKKYHSATSRDGVESLLRTILGLPVKQFKIVLQLCGGNLTDILKNSVKTFSVTERAEVVSGSWIGLAEDNPESAVTEKFRLIGYHESSD